MTPADMRKLADGEDESPMGQLLRDLARLMEATEHALDYLLDDDYKTTDMRAALARVKALKP